MVAANIKKVIEDDGSIQYYLGDLHHNPEGSTVIAYDGLYREYWFKGIRHRIDGSAIEYVDSDYEYFYCDSVWKVSYLLSVFCSSVLFPPPVSLFATINRNIGV